MSPRPRAPPLLLLSLTSCCSSDSPAPPSVSQSAAAWKSPHKPLSSCTAYRRDSASASSRVTPVGWGAGSVGQKGVVQTGTAGAQQELNLRSGVGVSRVAGSKHLPATNCRSQGVPVEQHVLILGPHLTPPQTDLCPGTCAAGCVPRQQPPTQQPQHPCWCCCVHTGAAGHSRAVSSQCRRTLEGRCTGGAALTTARLL